MPPCFLCMENYGTHNFSRRDTEETKSAYAFFFCIKRSKV